MSAAVHSCSRMGGRGRHADRTPTMPTSFGRGCGLLVAAVPDPCPAACHTSCHVRGAAARTTRVRAGGRRAGGGRTSRPGHRSPQTPACQAGRTPAVRTAVVPEAADSQSAACPPLYSPSSCASRAPSAMTRVKGCSSSGMSTLWSSPSRKAGPVQSNRGARAVHPRAPRAMLPPFQAV
jgi:hypothetical protein